MESNTPRAREDALLEEELRRLERVRARRRLGRRDSVWQEFQVDSERIPQLRAVVESVLEDAGEGPAQRELQKLLAERMCPGAPELLMRALKDLPPDIAITHLEELHEIGASALTRWTRVGVMLAAGERNTAAELKDLPSHTPALSLWRDSELLRRGNKLRSLERFLERAPLTLVDDLIDQGTAFPFTGTERADAQENRYLLARRFPERLTEEQLDELDWPEESWRRRLLQDPSHEIPDDAPARIADLAAVASGDPQALTRLSGALEDRTRKLVLQLLSTADRPELWPKAIFKDEALWPVLENLCSGPIEAAHQEASGFVAWRDLRAAHGELLRVNPSAYERIGPHLGADEQWVREEAVGMEVYLDLRFAENGDSEALRKALNQLLALENRSPGTDANISWLRGRLATDRNRRGPLFNPYLELGVAHGAPQRQWREAWRRLRRTLQGRAEELSDINTARDLIRDMEAAQNAEKHPLYVLPIFPGRLFPTSRVSARLVSQAWPLPRRTEPVSEQQRERILLDALTSFLQETVSRRTG